MNSACTQILPDAGPRDHHETMEADTLATHVDVPACGAWVS
jgi:hypothetical protein